MATAKKAKSLLLTFAPPDWLLHINSGNQRATGGRLLEGTFWYKKLI
jgi:hypothetical protein